MSTKRDDPSFPMTDDLLASHLSMAIDMDGAEHDEPVGPPRHDPRVVTVPEQGWRPEGGCIGVLRLGHRPQRDKRMTTHVCLTSRALGADAVYVHERDARVAATVDSVIERFGGPFHMQGVDSWRAVIAAWKARGAHVAHLTMYGLAFDEGIARIQNALSIAPSEQAAQPPSPAEATPPVQPTTPVQPTGPVPPARREKNHPTIPSRGDLLIVLGAEKVPPELYGLADTNLAVGNQPHSEVAALSLLLDRVTAGAWVTRPFEGQVQVVPRERGKAVYPVKGK